MRLDKEEKGKCEMGGCKKKAAYRINTERAGMRGRILICRECLCALYKALSGEITPRSIETVKKREELF